MTEPDTPQPTIPPTPVLADAPPVEEPRRLKLAVGLLWTIATGHFLGSGWCLLAYNTGVEFFNLENIVLSMLVYHALVGIAYAIIARALTQRRPWAPAACARLFLWTIVVQLVWPLGADLVQGMSVWDRVGAMYVFLGLVAGPPMLLYIILGIVALVQLRRPGVRALLG